MPRAIATQKPIDWAAILRLVRLGADIGSAFLPPEIGKPLTIAINAANKELDREAVRRQMTRAELIAALDAEFPAVGQRLADDIARLEKRTD